MYGAGYLDECETYFAAMFTDKDNTVAWDPANFAARSKVPTLFINSDSDVHFSINSTTKTAGLTDNAKISIHHRFGHNYTLGWGRQEIYQFAEAMVKSGKDPFLTVTDTKAENGALTAKVAYPEGVSLAGVSTYYITEPELAYGGGDAIEWKAITDYIQTAEGISVSIPEGATFIYASLKDSNGNVISTKYVPVK